VIDNRRWIRAKSKVARDQNRIIKIQSMLPETITNKIFSYGSDKHENDMSKRNSVDMAKTLRLGKGRGVVVI
jgi:hypothetical protein